MRPECRVLQVIILIGMAPLLLFALRWLAMEFPNWDERSRMIWANDQIVIWSRSSSNPFITKDSIEKARLLLNVQSGRFSHLPLPQQQLRRISRVSPINDITQDGRLVWTTEDDSSRVYVTDPESLATHSCLVPSLSELQLLGGRYFMEYAFDRVKYIDLQESHPITHTVDNFAPFYLARAIPDHPHFYCIRPTSHDRQAKSVGTKATPTKPESVLPHPFQPSSNPPGEETCCLALVRMTGRGPEEVADWPVHWNWGNPEIHVKADGPYIFCRALDGRDLHVHDANNGEVIAKIDLTSQPNSAGPVRWQANRHSIRIGEATHVYDPATGHKLPYDLGQKVILDRKGDRYLTLPNSPAPNVKQPDHDLQVCKYPTGELLTTLAHPALHAYPPNLPASQSMRFSIDGRQVIVCTQDERVFVFEASTGKLIRTLAASPWRYLGMLAVVLATATWLLAGWRVGSACRIPRWIQLLVASGLVLAFLMMRCSLNGHPYPPGRLAFQIGLALLIAWHTEVMQFVFRPGASVILRGLTLGGFFIFLPFLYCDGLSFEPIVLFWTAITLASSSLFLCQRMVGQLPALNEIESQTSKFSISELLLLTTVVAFLTTALVSMDWTALLANQYATTENMLTFAGLGVAAICLRVWWWLRLGCICVCTLTVTIIAVTQYPDIPGNYNFVWLLSTLLTPLALFSHFQVVERVPHSPPLLQHSSTSETR